MGDSLLIHCALLNLYVAHFELAFKVLHICCKPGYTCTLALLSMHAAVHPLPTIVIMTDIRECFIGTHDCSQVCVERTGGFDCSCSFGYELEEDGISCAG